MENTREYSIYIIRNKINDKVYIGQTSQSVAVRFSQHMKPSTTKQRGTYKIYNAVNKYGKENFYYEILEEHLTSEQADEREVYYIKQFNSYENGYNSTRGADTKTISRVQDVEKLIEMTNNKCSISEIAKEFGVCKETVERTMRSLDIRYVMKVTEEYLLEHKDYMTNVDMAKDLNVNRATISRVFKRFGIPRGKGCSNALMAERLKEKKNEEDNND